MENEVKSFRCVQDLTPVTWAPVLLQGEGVLYVTLTLTGRGERMRASGPVERVVSWSFLPRCHARTSR